MSSCRLAKKKLPKPSTKSVGDRERSGEFEFVVAQDTLNRRYWKQVPASEATQPSPPKAPTSSEDGECCVCYEDVSADLALDCSHFVCRDCIGKLRTAGCPMCRQPMTGKLANREVLEQIDQRKDSDTEARNEAATRAFISQLSGASERELTIARIVNLEVGIEVLMAAINDVISRRQQ